MLGSRGDSTGSFSCQQFQALLQRGKPSIHKVGPSLRTNDLQLIFRKLKEGQRPKASSYDKFMDIELSSPLGRFDNMVYN